jgi:hypothetical protein
LAQDWGRVIYGVERLSPGEFEDVMRAIRGFELLLGSAPSWRDNLNRPGIAGDSNL